MASAASVRLVGRCAGGGLFQVARTAPTLVRASIVSCAKGMAADCCWGAEGPAVSVPSELVV